MHRPRPVRPASMTNSIARPGVGLRQPGANALRHSVRSTGSSCIPARATAKAAAGRRSAAPCAALRNVPGQVPVPLFVNCPASNLRRAAAQLDAAQRRLRSCDLRSTRMLPAPDWRFNCGSFARCSTPRSTGESAAPPASASSDPVRTPPRHGTAVLIRIAVRSTRTGKQVPSFR